MIDVDLLTKMRDTLVHRGPDAAGIWAAPDRTVVLAHRRLAVIDLSEAANQPMIDGGSRNVLVFNGEIYNFRRLREELGQLGKRFRTTSDTEVLLEAYRTWGTRCVDRLVGAFAFAIYDVDRGELFLARDRAGEKPLFYRHAGGVLTFASELKALLADPAVPRSLDRDALEWYLAYGYVPGEMCLLAGISKLPPGHALVYDIKADRLRQWAYWTLPAPNPDRAADVDDLCNELEALLDDSVRQQLVADVPIGILLSGGVDSSLITAVAARNSSAPVRTFTATFPGHGQMDEGPYARQVADAFGTDHTELVIEPANLELLPVLAHQYDEPIADSSIIPTFLVCDLIRTRATVALGGDGGDELFAGYPHHQWVQRQAQLRRLVPAGIRQAVAGWATGLPVGTRARNQLIGVDGSIAQGISAANLFFDAHSRAQLLAPLTAAYGTAATVPETAKAESLDYGASPLQQSTRADFGLYLPDDLLVKVDRASMLRSLELRAPFLDHRIIEFAFARVPDRLRATPQARKVLLRHLARRLLPAGLNLRRKQGFSIPLDSWLRGESGRYFRAVLESITPKLFDQRAVVSLLRGHEQGRANAQRIFALTFLELWRREYNVELPAS